MTRPERGARRPPDPPTSALLFQLPFKAPDTLAKVWIHELKKSLGILPAWVASKDVKHELQRFACAFFAQQRPGFQDEFDAAMKRHSRSNDAERQESLSSAAWCLMREDLAELAMSLADSPQEERNMVLQRDPQTMIMTEDINFGELWTTASCNIVSLSSRVPPPRRKTAASNDGDSSADHKRGSEERFPFRDAPIGRKACHLLVLDLLKALHDEMRAVAPVSDKQTYFQDLLGIKSFRSYPRSGEQPQQHLASAEKQPSPDHRVLKGGEDPFEVPVSEVPDLGPLEAFDVDLPDAPDLDVPDAPGLRLPEVPELMYTCSPESEWWVEVRNFKGILFDWVWAFYSDDRKRFQLGFRKAVEGVKLRMATTDINAAWQLWRDAVADELLPPLLYDEDYRNRVQNMSAQGLIDDKEANYKHSFMVAAHKLVVDGAKFAFDDALLEQAMLDTAWERLTDDKEREKAKKKAADNKKATTANLKNRYAQALDLLWSLLRDLEHDCPLLGQPLAARQASYFRTLLNLEPVRVPVIPSRQKGTQGPSQSIYDDPRECWSLSERGPDDFSDTDDPSDSSQGPQTVPKEITVVTLFPFKVDTFITLWKQSLQMGASSNVLHMVMDPAIVQHLFRFKLGYDRCNYEKELYNRGDWEATRLFLVNKLCEGPDIIDPSTMKWKVVSAKIGRQKKGRKGWMLAWLWATHALVTDGAKYLTPEGTPPSPQDKVKFKAVREVCLELLHCVCLDSRANPNGYWGSMNITTKRTEGDVSQDNQQEPAQANPPRKRPRHKKATQKEPAPSTHESPQVPQQSAPDAAAGADASQPIDLPRPEGSATDKITRLQLRTASLQRQGETLANTMSAMAARWDQRAFATLQRVERERGQRQPDDIERLMQRAEVLQMQNETLAEAMRAVNGHWNRQVSDTLREVERLRAWRVQLLLSESFTS